MKKTKRGLQLCDSNFFTCIGEHVCVSHESIYLTNIWIEQFDPGISIFFVKLENQGHFAICFDDFT